MINKIDTYQTIGIIGLAKNTGKTTTLNAFISYYKNERLGLTSIGLDGERIDQVNFLPKPRIHVYKQMIVATSKACLETTTATYRILVETPFLTALGKVIIVVIEEEGDIVLAGPTTNHELNILLKLMKMYATRIFVDGALSRITFSALSELDGIVLTTGAAFSVMMDETIQKTAHILNTFSYPITHLELPNSASFYIKTNTSYFTRTNKSLEAMYSALKLTKDITHVYIKGAITERFIDMMIDLKIKGFTLIIDDATKLLFHYRMATVFDKLNIKVEVKKQTPIIMITINPFSPVGAHYDSNIFLKRISALTTIPVINVMEEASYGK
ncbi:MAG: hypothetical protein WC992_00515 [Acholeplasmataceae bacterium]|jgi:hypothetical protein|nr:hypothetical protein [Acholeplasmataceae bacterium]